MPTTNGKIGHDWLHSCIADDTVSIGLSAAEQYRSHNATQVRIKIKPIAKTIRISTALRTFAFRRNLHRSIIDRRRIILGIMLDTIILNRLEAMVCYTINHEWREKHEQG